VQLITVSILVRWIGQLKIAPVPCCCKPLRWAPILWNSTNVTNLTMKFNFQKLASDFPVSSIFWTIPIIVDCLEFEKWTSKLSTVIMRLQMAQIWEYLDVNIERIFFMLTFIWVLLQPLIAPIFRMMNRSCTSGWCFVQVISHSSKVVHVQIIFQFIQSNAWNL